MTSQSILPFGDVPDVAAQGRVVVSATPHTNVLIQRLLIDQIIAYHFHILEMSVGGKKQELALAGDGPIGGAMFSNDAVQSPRLAIPVKKGETFSLLVRNVNMGGSRPFVALLEVMIVGPEKIS